MCMGLFQNVIRRTPVSTMADGRVITIPQIDGEMSHQLYVLQSLLFNLLDERKLTKADPSDQVREIHTVN